MDLCSVFSVHVTRSIIDHFHSFRLNCMQAQERMRARSWAADYASILILLTPRGATVFYSSSSAANPSSTELGTSHKASASFWSSIGSAPSNSVLFESSQHWNSSIASSTSKWVGTGTVVPAASGSSANISSSSSALANVSQPVNSSWIAIESCNAAWQAYLTDHVTTSSWPAVVTNTASWVTYFPPPDVKPYTTFCDGTPRAHGVASLDYTTTVITENYSSTATITDFKAPTPICSINSKDCARLWQNWFDKSGINDAEPGCSSTCDGSLSTTDYMGNTLPPCYIQADELQLAYWPVTVEGNLCGNRSTIADETSTGRMASIWGTTIASPGVIVSFNSIYAVDNCGSTLGEVLTGYLLSQQSSQISTQCGAYHQVFSLSTWYTFSC